MYVPHAQVGTRAMTFVVKSGQAPGQVLSAARDIVRRLDARLPLVFPGSLPALEDAARARPRFYLGLLAVFAGLALVLAAVGIYGVVSYAVTERTREIGVRMALGAGRRQVISLMMWYGLRPSALGMVAGLGGALATTQVMRGLLYEVEPTDPLTFAAVSGVLLAVACGACALPAWRASRVPPAEALRGE
jgi:ABC-type antimicrobial peptide transport system permease subunit